MPLLYHSTVAGDFPASRTISSLEGTKEADAVRLIGYHAAHAGGLNARQAPFVVRKAHHDPSILRSA